MTLAPLYSFSGCSNRATCSRPQRQVAGSGPWVTASPATASRSASAASAVQSPPHQAAPPPGCLLSAGMPSRFDTDTAVVPLGSGVYDTRIDGGWCAR